MLLRDKKRRMLLGRVRDIGLPGALFELVRPRPVYAPVEIDTLVPLPFVVAFAAPLPFTAPSAAAEPFSACGFGSNAGGSSSIGESGGGGMSVPAVRDGRVARTGSSKRPFDKAFEATGADVEGMVVV